MYDTGDHDVSICGCPNGSNVKVTHNDSTVRLATRDSQSFAVSIDEWRHAVNEFSAVVRQFYDDSLPKTATDDTDSAGFAKMMDEWERRRTQA
jgi:hypothetical protein